MKIDSKASANTSGSPSKRFQFKKENVVPLTLDYDRVMEGIRDINFSNIDNNLRTEYLETKLREMILEQVEPIVTLSKKNLLYNATKNQKIEELEDFTKDICSKLEDTRSDLFKLSSIKDTVKENREMFNRHVVTATTHVESIEHKIDSTDTRLDDHDSRLKEMRSYISTRDKKIT